MGLPLFSEIEKLINEHGSAVILKERLALAADQYVALERKLADALSQQTVLSQQMSDLETQNERLQLDLQNAQQQIDELTQNVEDSAKANGDRRSANEEKILVHVAANEGSSAAELAGPLAISPVKTKAYLNSLQTAGFVSSTLNLHIRDSVWYPTAAGHQYLLDFDLLP